MAFRKTIVQFSLIFVFFVFLFSCTDTSTPTSPAVNHIAPAVEWVSPQAGGELSGVVELRFIVSDEGGIDSARIYLNGYSPDSWRLPASDDNNYNVTWDTREVADDIYILEARAWDKAGNLGTSPSLMVRVRNGTEPPTEDHTPPVVTWIEPLPNGELSNLVLLRFQAMDNVGVDSVRVYRNGYSPIEFYLPGHTGIDYELSWNTRSDSDGVYILEIRAWDESGNIGFSPSLVVQVVNNPQPPEDRIPPDVWWEAPEPGSTLMDTVTLRLRVFDESGVDSVRLYRNGAIVRSDVPAGNEYVYEWDTTSDSDGVHLWEARAWDAFGNTGVSAGLLVRVQNHETPSEDHTPPVIRWISPTPGDTIEGTVELCFDVIDNNSVDSVWVWLDGAIRWKMRGKIDDIHYSLIWTIDKPDGIHYILCGGLDAGGNIGYSPPIGFYVWNNRPRVIWVPDEYEKIQDAVFVARNADTVRVRPGIYTDFVYIQDYQNIWLESAEGPEETIIDATGEGFGIVIGNGVDSSCGVRGFTIRNSESLGIIIGDSSQKIYNNIIFSAEYGLQCGAGWSIMRNNIINQTRRSGFSLFLLWGECDNNIVINTGLDAFWNSYIHKNPVKPDYNLIWNYGYLTNEPPINFGNHNIIDLEPLFEEGSYRLREGSPGIDQGRPDLRDPDGSHSDIGAYGGPYAYPIR